MSHQLSIVRDGYAATWVCSCGWTRQTRDRRGHHIPGSNLAAIQHATTSAAEKDTDG